VKSCKFDLLTNRILGFLKIFVILLYLLSASNLTAELSSTKNNSVETFIDLKWSKKEIETISELFPFSSIHLYKDATERKFKEMAPKARIIHLATHAIINDANPMTSKLAFSTVRDSKEDGFLNTYELYRMKLSAELVVLSACNTGYGKIIKGEGIMSMARGFKYSGCNSLIVSLWPLDDRSTSNIIREFYLGLIRGKTKDSALRDAKLKYLENANSIQADPLFWAGLVSIGRVDSMKLSTIDTNRISRDSRLSYFLIPLLIGLIVLFKKQIVK